MFFFLFLFLHLFRFSFSSFPYSLPSVILFLFCYCSVLPITAQNKSACFFFQFHKSFPQFYFTVRFPIIFYFSVVLPLVFAISWFIRLNSIFCQCTYDFCLLSFRVFTFLHVSFQFWFIIFCSFNGGMSSFCRDFLGFCKKRFLIKIIQFSTCFCFILAVACLKTLFI